MIEALELFLYCHTEYAYQRITCNNWFIDTPAGWFVILISIILLFKISKIIYNMRIEGDVK